MPPRSLKESLQALLALGLIVVAEEAPAPRHEAMPPRRAYGSSAFGALAGA